MKHLFTLLLFSLLILNGGSVIAQCSNPLVIDLVQQNGNMITVATQTQTPSGSGNYVWNFGDGNSSNSGWMATHIYNQPGVYSLYVNLYDSLDVSWCAMGIITVVIPGQQCFLETSFDYENLPNGIVHFNNVTISNGMAPFTYNWYFSDGQTSNLTEPNLTFVNGNYQACLVLQDANGCADSLCMEFNVSNGLCANNYMSSQGPNISGSNLTLGIFYNNNLNYPINLSIEYGDGFIENTELTSAYTAYHDYGAINTVFNLCAYAEDASGCRDTLCYEVLTGPCVDSSAFFSSILMPNNEIQFIASTNNSGPLTYEWNFGDGTAPFTSTTSVSSHYYSNPGLYLTCLTITNSDGCVGNYCQNVNVQGPCANFQVNAGITYSGMSATVITQVNSSCGNIIYNWTATGATTTSGVQNLTATYPSAGNYQIQLSVTDGCGCSQTLIYNIVISCNSLGGDSLTNVSIFNGAFSTCNSNFFDTGLQSGQYQNNENITFTVYPSSAEAKSKVTFNSFSTESNYDYLRIYNGNSTNSPLLANLSGSIPANTSYTSTANDGSLTFQWVSDFSVIAAGWNATLSCSDLTILATNLQNGNWMLDAQSNTSYTDYIWTVDNQTIVTTVPSLTVPLSEGYHQVCLSANSILGCSQTTCIQIDVPCTYQLDVDYSINGNQVEFIINNYDSTMYYSLSGQTSQTWMQLTNATTTLTFPTAIDELFCIWADGVCFDSACVQITLPLEGTQAISGIVWDDTNGNGLFDSNEFPIANSYVTLCIGNDTTTCIFAYTDSNGMYSFNVYPGEYTVQSHVWQDTYLATNPVGGQGYLINVNDISLGQFNFGWQNQSVTISGTVFYDTNNNGNQDAGENPVIYKAVQIGNSIVYTNSFGQYTIQKLPGTYLISLENPGVGYSITVPSGSNYTINASNIGQVYSGYNFGLWADPSFADLYAGIYQISTVTPGFPVMNHLSYCNNGVSESAGVFTFYWDPILAISNPSVFSPAPTTFSAATNMATWSFNSLSPGDCGYIFMNAPAPQSLALGTPVICTAIVTPLNDSNPTNNIDTLHQSVVGSWDPNDKQAVPAGLGLDGRILPNTNLKFTIRFQNTGSAPAVNVVLIDTISTDFVLETFHMNAASDAYFVEVDQDTRTIRWVFNNIMLPDSTSDPIGSIGFVNFSIDPVQNQVDGTVLNNFADIYFDFNEPIRTNTTVHTIDRLLGITSIENGPKVHVYPNPFTTSTNFLVNTTDNSRSEVVIHDVLGKKVSSFSIESGKPYTYSASNLSSGMYFYTVTNNTTSSTGKLVVK